MTRRLFDTRLALIAATFLAVSGYDIIYALSALSESDANLIFLLAVLLWLSKCLPAYGRTDSALSAWLPRFGSGVLLGLAFTANYRLSIYIGTLLVIDVILLWQRCGWRRIPGPVTAWAMGGAVAPVAWLLLGRLAETHGIVLFRGEVTYRPTSYLAEVLYQIHGGNHPGGGFGALPYAQWYVARQGWPCTILLAVGLFYAGIKREPRMLIPAAFVVIPYVVYAFAPFIVPRNLEATIPFSAIVAAIGLRSLAHAVSPPRRAWPLLALSVAIVTGLGVLRAWPIVGVQSGFTQAAKYVEGHGGRGALVSNEVMMFYFRDSGTACDAVQMPTTARAPAIADRFEYEYAVVDGQSKPFAQYLVGHARRVAQYPVLGVNGLREDLIRSENGHPPRATARGYVAVYWLDTLTAGATGSVGKQPTCSLDRLA